MKRYARVSRQVSIEKHEVSSASVTEGGALVLYAGPGQILKAYAPHSWSSLTVEDVEDKET